MSDKSHLPMLAKSYDPAKVVFPCGVQPKLDGIRCLAEVHAGNVISLRSRDAKPLTMPHVVHALRECQLPTGLILDGELYTHNMPFAELSGNVRRSLDDERKQQIQYWIYDVMAGPDELHTQPWDMRLNAVERIVWDDNDLNRSPDSILQLVRTTMAANLDELARLEQMFVAEHYEGAMIRTAGVVRATKANPDGGSTPDFYQCAYYGHARRSDFLQKLKRFDDAEAVITGLEEEVDLEKNAKGRTGAFILREADGTTFRASGLSAEMKTDSWQQPQQYIGQVVTFKYFGRSETNVPRHPNFKAMRPTEGVDAAI